LIQSEGRQKRFSDGALEMLLAYEWPGNVRELRNVVHFSYVLAGDVIDVDSLPREVVRDDRQPPATAMAMPGQPADAFTVRVGSTIAEVERCLIMATLRQCDNNKPRTADMLGISLKTLYNRLNQYQATEAPATEAPVADR
jgi:DNA-binding NtrC family response regulator